MPTLIQPLFTGPIDVVGDVHGERDALEALLGHLGYGDGRHPEGRRLVFVGDLVDRGPDSPAVVERVMDLCERGVAQCLMGNHELNLVNGQVKHGNHWFTRPDDPGPREPPGQRPVSPEQRRRFERFFDHRPLALERDDLRVVHACWDQDAIEALRELGDIDSVRARYAAFSDAIGEALEADGVTARRRRELTQHSTTDRSSPPPLLPAVAENDLRRQLNNPIRVITSGVEQPSAPFWASGKWRMVSRARWWAHYHGATPTLIGHYWRRPPGVPRAHDGGPDVFAGVPFDAWMGPERNVFCVDYSVGQRYLERAQGAPPFKRRLSAMRVPEWRLVDDDGQRHRLRPPGAPDA